MATALINLFATGIDLGIEAPAHNRELAANTSQPMAAMEFAPAWQCEKGRHPQPAGCIRRCYTGTYVQPGTGGSHPRGRIAGIQDSDTRDMTPFRVTATGQRLSADLTHHATSIEPDRTRLYVLESVKANQSKGAVNQL